MYDEEINTYVPLVWQNGASLLCATYHDVRMCWHGAYHGTKNCHPTLLAIDGL
jgi:hypothetical protein